MRKVALLIAMSLDGYIADSAGGVDWLKGQDDAAEYADPYPAFIQRVDTVIMGWNTYRQVVTELSPAEWPYSGLKTYVITHQKGIPDEEHIRFVNESPCDLVRRLAGEAGNDIWICGGASVIHPLMRENLIDLYDISVIPMVLGAGVRLFGTMEVLELRLTNAQSSNGITELVYERR